MYKISFRNKIILFFYVHVCVKKAEVVSYSFLVSETHRVTKTDVTLTIPRLGEAAAHT